jgi:hypothetical protein
MANAPYYNEGLHVGTVLGQGLSEAGTGTAQFLLRVKVLGEVTGDDGSYQPSDRQYERSIYMALTEKTRDFVVDNLKLLGFDGSSMAQLDLSHPKAVSFVGKQVDLWCKHDAYNGKTSEKWSLAMPRKEMESLDAKKMRQLDSLFGKALASKPKSTKPEDENQDPTQITDDDIPF